MEEATYTDPENQFSLQVPAGDILGERFADLLELFLTVGGLGEARLGEWGRAVRESKGGGLLSQGRPCHKW